MKDILNKIFNWLVLSSENPDNLSATLKGSIAFTVITALASVLHINGLSDAADHGLSFIVETGKFLSMAYTLYGSIRKIHRTATGTNAVLNSSQI